MLPKSSKLFNIIILVAGLGLFGCSYPGSNNYPYDVFDRDADTITKLMISGGDGILKSTAVSDSVELEALWGKTKTATIVKRIHVAMRAYYWVDVETNAGEKKQIFIGYVPNMGRVEVVVNAIK